MYQKILLAYDSSREGALALREGVLLARTCGAKVYVLSVAPRVTDVMAASVGLNSDLTNEAQGYRDLLDRAVERLAGYGMKVEARLMVGEPAPTIGAFAREIKADLVVVGHRSRNFVSRWWFGSTGAYISDHVSCSLLVARRNISDADFDAAMRA